MPRTESLISVAVGRSGPVKGARAAHVVIWWALAVQELGRPLGDGDSLTSAIRDYAEYSASSERTAWRDLRRFREVFPEHDTPAPLAAQVAAAVNDRMSRRESNALMTTAIAV